MQSKIRWSDDEILSAWRKADRAFGFDRSRGKFSTMDRDYLCAQVRGFQTGATPSPSEGPMAPCDSSPAEPWATPRSGKTTSEDEDVWRARQQNGEVATRPLTLQVQMTDGQKKKSRGLNPRFALWLMGFPTWWLDGIETPKKSRNGQRPAPEKPSKGRRAPKSTD